MFTALFTTAKTWKQSKCPSTDEQITKMWYIYPMDYYTAMKNEIPPFAAADQTQGIMLSETSQRKTHTV